MGEKVFSWLVERLPAQPSVSMLATRLSRFNRENASRGFTTRGKGGKAIATCRATETTPTRSHKSHSLLVSELIGFCESASLSVRRTTHCAFAAIVFPY
jgi:hypothetical protein